MWNFPNCTGAIDGKYTIIKASAKSRSFFTYIILLAVVDAHYRIIFIDIDSNGSASDNGVFNKTTFCKNYNKGN